MGAAAATATSAPAASRVSLLHLLAERPGPAVVRFAFEDLSRDFIADDGLAELINVHDPAVFLVRFTWPIDLIHLIEKRLDR